MRAVRPLLWDVFRNDQSVATREVAAIRCSLRPVGISITRSSSGQRCACSPRPADPRSHAIGSTLQELANSRSGLPNNSSYSKSAAPGPRIDIRRWILTNRGWCAHVFRLFRMLRRLHFTPHTGEREMILRYSTDNAPVWGCGLLADCHWSSVMARAVRVTGSTCCRLPMTMACITYFYLISIRLAVHDHEQIWTKSVRPELTQLAPAHFGQ